MGITTDQIDGITNGNVVSTNGDKIGGIGQVYLDDNSGEPNWVTVKTGLFGTSESFVPLDGADLRGGDIVVKYDKATVKDAPRVDADGSISPEEEEALYSYYGLGGTNAGYDTDRDYATRHHRHRSRLRDDGHHRHRSRLRDDGHHRHRLRDGGHHRPR